METQRLLVLDDEVEIADLVASIFTDIGYEVDAFYDPHQALDAFAKNDYSLIIVDVMMPGMDGFEFCRRLGQKTDVPVVFLSAKDHETDVITGLALGADDYVTKPFKPRELVARVKAHLRRYANSKAAGTESRQDDALTAKGITVLPSKHKAYLHDMELQLTPKEFDILLTLVKRKGEPVASKDLYESVWKEQANASSSNTIMVHIRHLRSKLAQIDSSEQMIQNVWGVGYKIAP